MDRMRAEELATKSGALGGVLHDKGTGKEVYPVVHTGRPDKGHAAVPRQFQETQVKDIAA